MDDLLGSSAARRGRGLFAPGYGNDRKVRQKTGRSERHRIDLVTPVRYIQRIILVGMPYQIGPGLALRPFSCIQP